MEDCEADLRLPLGSECEGWGGGGQSAEEKIASTQGKPELWPRGYARSSCPTITGLRYGNQQNGLREDGIFGTRCDSCPMRVGAYRGTDMCKLKLQAEKAMPSGIGGAASAASSSVGEEGRVRTQQGQRTLNL